MSLTEIWGGVTAERVRQRALWNRPHEWGYGDCSSKQVAETTKLAVLLEEVGEVAQAVLAKDSFATRDELIQVAAVAVAWLESYDQ